MSKNTEDDFAPLNITSETLKPLDSIENDILNTFLDPIDPYNEKELERARKKERRKKRNRMFAAQSRERKKLMVDNLIKENKELKEKLRLSTTSKRSVATQTLAGLVIVTVILASITNSSNESGNQVIYSSAAGLIMIADEGIFSLAFPFIMTYLLYLKNLRGHRQLLPYFNPNPASNTASS